MDFQPGAYTVDRIIALLRAGRIALPEFQRDFVWSPAKVVELIDSVSRGWPIGSLLLLSGPQPFEARAIDGAPDLRGEVDVFVLDGQQRITALFHAIADVSDICYYVDFRMLAAEEREYVFWKKRPQFQKELGALSERARRGIALVQEVADNEAFFAWQSNLSTEEARQVLALRERSLSGLKSKVYRLPVVELEHEIELEALARIFETINRTGVKLNAFDLMVAVLYPHDFKLRDEWDDALVKYPLLARFDVDGVELLKLIALWVRRSQQAARSRVTVRGVRQGDVLAVPPVEVKNNWKRAVSAYDDALKFLVGSLGVAHPSLAPPSAMILAMAAFMDSDLDTTLTVSDTRRWYWDNIRAQSYAQGANTRVVADVDRAVRSSSELIDSLPMDDLGTSLLEPVRRNKILLNGLGSLLTLKGARDPLTGELLGGAGHGPIVARSIESLARGQARPDEDALVASVIFGRERSFSELAAKIRRGASLKEACDPVALTSQFVDSAALLEDFSARASQLNKLLSIGG